MTRAWIAVPAIAVLWGLLCLVSMLVATGGHLSMPLDDSYIFFQYAKQTAAGNFLRYQPAGEISAGATSPLTVAVHTVGYLVGFRGSLMSAFALLVGTGALILTGIHALRLGRRLCPRAPWILPALLLSSGPLVWGFMSGMDLPLFVALAVAFAAAWPEKDRLPSRSFFIWGTLLGLSRPDAVFLILPAFVFGLRFAGRRRWWALPLAGAAFPFVLQILVTGSAQSASMDVKSVLASPGLTFGDWLARGLSFLQMVIKGALDGSFISPDTVQFASNDGSAMGFYLPPFALALFLLGLAPGAWEEGRQRLPGLNLVFCSWTVLLLLAVAFTVPRSWHWHRYLMPVFAFVLVGVAVGAHRVGGAIESLGNRLRQGDGARIAGVLLILLSLPGAVYFVLAYGRNSADIHFQHIELARRFADSRPVRPSLLGLHDAGALTYFGDYRVLDIEGLVSPEFRGPARLGAGGVWETMEQLPPGQRPDVLAVYDNWFDPTFLIPHRRVHSQRLFRPTISAGNPLHVYLGNWELAGKGDRPRDPTLVETLGELTLMADVDVADLRSEKEASYRFHVLDGAYDSVIEHAVGTDGQPLLEGGRVISGWEAFTVKGTRPGDSLILVTRNSSAFRLRVEVDGAHAGRWVQGSVPPDTWQETRFAISEKLVTGKTTEVRLVSDDPHHSAYPAFHYWVYRR